ncbi:hypothetical protein SOVF_125470 [Spinacia oleracea]|nr:hypothetical protein SOVF_125470 [Spinacia oleracea]
MENALHYLANDTHILKFDLAAETFERIPLSIITLARSTQMLLGVIGVHDCLCISFVHDSKVHRGRSPEWIFELWSLQEYNDWDSWTKLYVLDLNLEMAKCCTTILGLTYRGFICVQIKDGGLALIDARKSAISPVIVFVRESKSEAFKMIDYVESLVSPFSILKADDTVDDDDLGLSPSPLTTQKGAPRKMEEAVHDSA